MEVLGTYAIDGTNSQSDIYFFEGTENNQMKVFTSMGEKILPLGGEYEVYELEYEEFTGDVAQATGTLGVYAMDRNKNLFRFSVELDLRFYIYSGDWRHKANADFYKLVVVNIKDEKEEDKPIKVIPKVGDFFNETFNGDYYRTIVDLDSTINIIKKTNISNYWSWGMTKMLVDSFENTKWIRFNVNGYKFRGHVYITCNGLDYIDIFFTSQRGRVKQVREDIDISMVNEVITNIIEFNFDYYN